MGSSEPAERQDAAELEPWQVFWQNEPLRPVRVETLSSSYRRLTDSSAVSPRGTGRSPHTHI